MLDIGWQELFIIAAVGIVVVGPKDLPRAIAKVSKVVRRARGMARDFQSSIDDVVREAELDDIRKQVDGAADFDLGKEIENSIDPDGDMADEIGLTDLKSSLEDTAETMAVDTEPETDNDDNPKKEGA
ncbi:MAG: twin-arginine translocase subunit TatB [Rhodospirillales bacterium]|jgi:sec-independent protein translocase protein TatB|nr:twin-arginine translocase subunit TatB [Rhodospirillales bacterium]